MYWIILLISFRPISSALENYNFPSPVRQTWRIWLNMSLHIIGPLVYCCNSWWRHQMETFSALLAFCAGNSPVPVNSPHKGQWRGVLMFSLICAWIHDWANNREAGDLRRHRGQYDVIVMLSFNWGTFPEMKFGDIIALYKANDLNVLNHYRQSYHKSDVLKIDSIQWNMQLLSDNRFGLSLWHSSHMANLELF